MKKILILDDDKMLITLLAKKISNSLGFGVDTAFSLDEARALLSEGNEYLICFAEPNLAPNSSEILDFLLAQSLRLAVLTANNDKKLKEQCLQKDILAYLYKESSFCVEQMLHLIKMLDEHQNEKVILAMSKINERNELKKALNLRLFNVLVCAHGEEALNYLADNEDVRLIICDAKMPVIDAAGLIAEVKEQYPRSDIDFIILGEKDEGLEAEFLNENVSEFITKPFGKELFNARLDKYLKTKDSFKMLELFKDLEPQTGAKNSYGLKNEFEDYLRDNAQMNEEFAFAFLEIDDVQGIKEEYGSKVSQMMMKVATQEALKATMGKDIVGHLNPQRLCIVLKDTSNEAAIKVLSTIRKNIREKSVLVSLDELYFSVCIGVSFGRGAVSFNELSTKASKALVLAQNGGKDRVEVCF